MIRMAWVSEKFPVSFDVRDDTRCLLAVLIKSVHWNAKNVMITQRDAWMVTREEEERECKARN